MSRLKNYRSTGDIKKGDLVKIIELDFVGLLENDKDSPIGVANSDALSFGQKVEVNTDIFFERDYFPYFFTICLSTIILAFIFQSSSYGIHLATFITSINLIGLLLIVYIWEYISRGG